MGRPGGGYNQGVPIEVPPQTTNGKAHGPQWTAPPGPGGAARVADRVAAQGHIEVSMPARAESLQLARLSAAYVAAQADLLYDEVQDLRLAIDELCSPLVGTRGRPGQLHLRYQWDRSWLEVSCSVAVAGDGVSGEDDSGERELSDRILEALVDEHGSTTDGDVVSVWLRKRRPGNTD